MKEIKKNNAVESARGRWITLARVVRKGISEETIFKLTAVQPLQMAKESTKCYVLAEKNTYFEKVLCRRDLGCCGYLDVDLMLKTIVTFRLLPHSEVL